MARTVIPPQAAVTRFDEQAAATRLEGSKAASGDAFPDKLVKYVPAEALAFFTPISASLGPGRTRLLIVAIVAGLFGTPAYLWLTARTLPAAKRPMVHFYLLAALAFVCWVIGTSASVDALVGLDEVEAGVVLGIAVFVIPLIDNLITAVFGAEKIGTDSSLQK